MRKSTQWGEIEHQSCKGPYVSIYSANLKLGNGTHCHAAIHVTFLWGVDEEEGESRDEHKGSNYTNVL
jgi:hypothetical protein